MTSTVYCEVIGTEWVPSNQSKSRKYEVSVGEVDWSRNGETEFVVYVRVWLLSDGNWFPQSYSAHMHVTPGDDGKSDFDNVMEAQKLIKDKYLV